MSIYFKIYSNVADASAATAGNVTYSVVRDDATAVTGGATATTVLVGQRWSGTVYSIAQYFTQFDTSAVSPGTGPTTLTINCTVVALATDDSLEIREVSSSATKIAGDSLAALPLYATLAVPTTTGKKTFTFSDITALSRSSTLKLLIHSQKERLNTAPTGDNRTTFNTADITGTTNDPVLEGLAGTAWDFVAAGTSVEATATSHILTEPAGVAAGDLLVACIASRIASTTQITLPSGWTRVNQALNNNTLSTSSALPSGMMAYILRGASPPSYTFTHPVAPNVALGRVVAYRNVNQIAPTDSGTTAVTTGTALLSISVAGLTTTADDDLIVALTAGGQEAAWSAFAATDPATSSGTTAASVLDPIWGQWLERAEQVTTTGNDTSLAIFDAVKQTAGATGNLIATASVSAGHVVVAGSFKLVPTGTTYNETVAETLTAAETVALLTESLVRETEAADLRETEDGSVRITEGDFFVTPAIDETIAESASAAETLTSALAYTKAVAETAAAVDTAGGLLVRLGAIAETASAADTVGGLMIRLGAVAETTSAAEITDAAVVPAAGVFDEIVAESASAADTPGGLLVTGKAIAESASVAETISKTLTYTGAVAETATAADTAGGLLLRIGAIAETASATETAAGLLTSTVAIAETAGAAETITYSVTGASGTTFNETLAETAAAAETVASVALSTGAIAETASAAETITKAVSYTGAIVETATVAETVTKTVLFSGAIAESASAAETTDASVIPASAVHSLSVAETASAAETLAGTLVTTKAVAETAAAVETITKAVSYTKAIVETASATDTVGRLVVADLAIAETVAASETITTTLDAMRAIAESVSAVDAIDCIHIRPWRPEAPLYQVWATDSPPLQAWARDASAFSAWAPQLPGRRMERSTEVYDDPAVTSGTRRITEAGTIRIIERLVQPWTREPRLANSWTKELV